MELSQNRVCDIRLDGGSSELDDELYNFLLENNLLHSLNPNLTASCEQLAFMVALDENQIYVPCSDEVFFQIMRDDFSPELKNRYRYVWRTAMRLLSSLPVDRAQRRRLRAFCRKRMRKILLSHDIIPSRALKRLTSVLISPGSCADDPWIARRQEQFRQQQKFFRMPELTALMDRMPVLSEGGMASARGDLDRTEFSRLACLAACPGFWKNGFPGVEAVRALFDQAEAVMRPIWEQLKSLRGGLSIILLLCDSEGGVLFDLLLARFFIERGHRVVYAVKDEFYFDAPTMRDMSEDPVLGARLRAELLCRNPAVSKNELLRMLREWRLIVISDGTRERLNLYRASVTFARAWKEADLILAHGWRLREMFMGTSHEFTRDILCWNTSQPGDGSKDLVFEAFLKPHARKARKFSELDIQRQADRIIDGMRQAHREGRPVVFYSCIIGSIPGQTATAMRLATVLVEDVARRLPGAFVINPAEHFEEGMDGDDFMYLWEQVQRSGYISIWYFETAEDIERGFRLLDMPMPEIWSGKDASYSTGCTKEMRIALEVQKRNPEMQILGPPPESFFRRSEYGVGKYFDAALVKR